MHSKKISSLLLFTFLSCSTIPIFATDTTAIPKATAKLISVCSISASDVSFGSYDPTSSGDAFASGNIKTKCTTGTSYSIGIDYSATVIDNTNKYSVISAGGNKWISYMTGQSNTDRLKFGLFQDSAHTKIFGNYNNSGGGSWSSQGTTVSVYKTGTGDYQDTPIYGAMTAKQYVTPDFYSVTHTANVYF